MHAHWYTTVAQAHPCARTRMHAFTHTCPARSRAAGRTVRRHRGEQWHSKRTQLLRARRATDATSEPSARRARPPSRPAAVSGLSAAPWQSAQGVSSLIRAGCQGWPAGGSARRGTDNDLWRGARAGAVFCSCCCWPRHMRTGSTQHGCPGCVRPLCRRRRRGWGQAEQEAHVTQTQNCWGHRGQNWLLGLGGLGSTEDPAHGLRVSKKPWPWAAVPEGCLARLPLKTVFPLTHMSFLSFPYLH